MKLTDNQNKSKTTASNTKKTVTKDTLNSRYSSINDKQEGPKGLTKISEDSDQKPHQQHAMTERTHTQMTSNHHQKWNENTNKKHDIHRTSRTRQQYKTKTTNDNSSHQDHHSTH